MRARHPYWASKESCPYSYLCVSVKKKRKKKNEEEGKNGRWSEFVKKKEIKKKKE